MFKRGKEMEKMKVRWGKSGVWGWGRWDRRIVIAPRHCLRSIILCIIEKQNIKPEVVISRTASTKV